MTRDHAIARAKAMREGAARMLLIAHNPRFPFGVRYAAVIQAEDYEEAAKGFDQIAEREKAR